MNSNKVNKIYNDIIIGWDNEFSDDILRLKPKNKLEFESLKNSSPLFIEKNILKINQIESFYKEIKKSKPDYETLKTLNFLYSKLENFSESNPFIWNEKENKKKLIDLSKLTPPSLKKVTLFINKKGKKPVKLFISKEVISKKNANKKMSEEISFSWFSHIFLKDQTIKENMNHSFLYLSPKTIFGKTTVKDKDIDIRSPLFLFPVKIIYHKKTWILENDPKRKIIINDFVKKHCLQNRDFIYNTKKTFNKNIKTILKENNNITNDTSKEFNPFEEEQTSLKDKLNKNFGKNKFTLENNMLLGIFSLPEDLEKNELKNEIDKKKVSSNLLKYISQKDINTSDEKKLIIKNYLKKINDDSDIFFTKKLNLEQLEILKKIDDDNVHALSIFAPPGTKEVETVTSIIQDSVAKGKRVIVVSENNKNLSLIHKDLNEIKKTSIFLEEKNTKESFFKQLRNSFLPTENIYMKRDDSLLNDLFKKYNELNSLYNNNGLNFIKKVKELYDKEYSSNEKIYNEWKNKNIFSKIKFDDLSIFEKTKKEIGSLEDWDQIEKIQKINETELFSFEDYRMYEKNLRNEIKKVNIDFIDKKNLSEESPSKKNSIDFEKTLYNKNSLNEELLFFESNSNLFEKVSHFEKTTLSAIGDLSKLNNISDLSIDILIDGIIFIFIEIIVNGPIFLEQMNIINNFKNIKKDIYLNEKTLRAYNKSFINKELKKNSMYDDSLIEVKKEDLKKGNYSSIKIFIKKHSLFLKKRIKVWIMPLDYVLKVFDSDNEFDIVIFVNSENVFIEKTISVMSKAKKLIIFGDENQTNLIHPLNKRIEYEKEKEMFNKNETLYSYGKLKFPSVSLKKHYYSNRTSLINFSNSNFYDGKINSINNISFDNDKPIEYEYINNSSYDEKINEIEADEIIKTLKKIKKERKLIDTIKIIVVSQQQKYLLMEKINASSSLNSWFSEIGIKIDSMDKLSVDKKDIIIFATNFVYNDEVKMNEKDFKDLLDDDSLNKINIISSMSKRKLIVISSIDLKYKDDIMQNIKNNKIINFLKYVDDNSKEEEKLDELVSFNSIIEENIYKELKDELKKKYNVVITNKYNTLGINLNFVLYNLKTKKEILAIQIDDGDFLEESPPREKNYLEWVYLKEMGWSVYKIWDINWWINKNKVKEELFLMMDLLINKK